MKDSEFIELLNLYLDHEISAADAARLEAEVQSNPQRHKIYREYCQMQKACQLLAADFQPEAERAPRARAIAPKQAWFFSRGTGAFAVGALAAAACVALIFTGRNPVAKTGEPAQGFARDSRAPLSAGLPTASAPAAASKTARPSYATVSVASRMEPARAMFGSDSKLPIESNRAGGTLTLATASSPQFDWMRAVQIAPLPRPVPVEELRFEHRPVNLRPDGRALGNSATAPADVEMAAFRFVK